MDKLKSKILLIFLISIVLCSVSAISAAEISDAGENNDVFDLSDDIENVEAESISNDEIIEASSDTSDAPTPDIDVNVSGDIVVGDTEHVAFNVSYNGDPLVSGTVNATIEGDNGYSDKKNGITFEAGVNSFDLSDLAPGKYTVKVLFGGDDNYGPAEGSNTFNVLPLNTTTEAEDVSGDVGDKVDITADILDKNNDPVQNGTATLTVNGKDYTADVKDGKATFKGVELTENTTATIKYEGNDYYNPSETTIEITVNDESPDEEPDDEPSEELDDEPSEEPDDEPDEEPTDGPVDDAVDDPVEEPASTVVKNVAAGNPIAMLLLVLMALVSTISIRRQK